MARKNKPKERNCFLCNSAILERERVKDHTVECIVKRSSSKQEHKENALASGAEERRDKLR